MVLLYSTGCSRCKILKMKLTQKGVPFDEITNEDAIVAAGVAEVPSLQVGDRLLGFMESIDWVNKQ